MIVAQVAILTDSAEGLPSGDTWAELGSVGAPLAVAARPCAWPLGVNVVADEDSVFVKAVRDDDAGAVRVWIVRDACVAREGVFDLRLGVLLCVAALTLALHLHHNENGGNGRGQHPLNRSVTHGWAKQRDGGVVRWEERALRES